MSGALAYHSGLAAEDAVARHYEARGHQIVRKRWKTVEGEVDLIAKSGDTVIFIEVKKSRSFERAAASLSPRQIARIYAAASRYLENEPLGQDTDTRFDVALMDETGRVEILENAICG